MSLNKKIKNDNFIDLDYNRIKEEVRDNINYQPQKYTIFRNKYMRLSLITIFVVFVGLFSIIAINTFSKDSKIITVSAAEKVQTTYADFLDEGFIEFKNKLDTFSSKLAEQIYLNNDNKEQNYVISPVSIYMALAMCVEGGSDKIREELLNALGMTYEEVYKYTKILYSSLNDEVVNSDNEKEIIYREIMANSIWIDNNIDLKQEGLLQLANNYNCTSNSAPFKDDNRKANQAIREYVKNNTKGLIDQNFQLDIDTLFALINTYYLKDVWNKNGKNLVYTKNYYKFNDLIETKLLCGYYYIGQAYETDMYTHFYTVTSNKIKMKFIVPKDGYTIDDIYSFDTLKSVNNIKDYKGLDIENKIQYETRCLFPEFEAKYDNDVKDILKKGFNINEFFTLGKNMTNLTNKKIVCDTFKHVTQLKVDKKGVEGAAVTIVRGAPGSAGGGDYEIVRCDYIVDKNFILLVTDSNDVPLFSGVIYNI